jgi:hypothetical protein
LAPVFAVADELRNGLLHAFRLPNQRITDQFGLVTHKRQSQRMLRRFVDVCLECRGPRPRKLTLETLENMKLWRAQDPSHDASHEKSRSRTTRGRRIARAK